MSEWYFLFSIAHKVTIGFAVIGVINGVFMQDRRRKDLASTLHQGSFSDPKEYCHCTKKVALNLEDARSSKTRSPLGAVPADD